MELRYQDVNYAHCSTPHVALALKVLDTPHALSLINIPKLVNDMYICIYIVSPDSEPHVSHLAIICCQYVVYGLCHHVLTNLFMATLSNRDVKLQYLAIYTIFTIEITSQFDLSLTEFNCSWI